MNIDNIHLLTGLKAANSFEVKAIEAKYKFGLALIGIAMLQNIQKERKKDIEDENILGSIEIENIIAMPEEVM